jgi:hypothetical protein
VVLPGRPIVGDTEAEQLTDRHALVDVDSFRVTVDND